MSVLVPTLANSAGTEPGRWPMLSSWDGRGCFGQHAEEPIPGFLMGYVRICSSFPLDGRK